MTTGPKKDLAHSIRQRLQQIAKTSGRPFQEIIQVCQSEIAMLLEGKKATDDEPEVKGLNITAAEYSATATVLKAILPQR